VRPEGDHPVLPSDEGASPKSMMVWSLPSPESPSSRRASTIAPISAASSSIESTSKGRTQSRKIATPISPIAGPVTSAVDSPANAWMISAASVANSPPATTSPIPRFWLSSASRPIGARVSISPNRNSTATAPT
jgi:hypothetical protein